MSHNTPPALSMSRFKSVIIKTGLSRSSIYEVMDEDSPRYDPDFPKPIALTARTIAWIDAELDQWLSGRIAKSRAKGETLSTERRNKTIDRFNAGKTGKGVSL